MRPDDEAAATTLRELIHGSEKICIFTGAGISTESGIDDFRSPGGVWSRMKPIQFADFLAEEATRLEDWTRRFRFQQEFDAAEPNDGHRACADLLESGHAVGIITQNIDGLHQRGGAPDDRVIEIHGNGTRAACLDCRSPMTLAEARRIIEETGRSPNCARCGGIVKAAVISFGQPMPQARMVEAERLALACDLFLVLGSSLIVHPAAALPQIAKNNGARLAIVNREPTPLDTIADVVVREPIGKAMRSAVAR